NLYQLGRLQAAEMALLLAKQIDPGHYLMPQLFLAEIYARHNEKNRAKAEIEELLAAGPNVELQTTLRAALAKLQ
ncbi:MAG: hypothetical protein ABI995_11145, partial [Acidobacteriota bacterium]